MHPRRSRRRTQVFDVLFRNLGDQLRFSAPDAPDVHFLAAFEEHPWQDRHEPRFVHAGWVYLAVGAEISRPEVRQGVLLRFRYVGAIFAGRKSMLCFFL